jgi:hypothetical protein
MAMHRHRPVDKVIRRWMQRLRTSKTLGFFEVHFRGKRLWKTFSTASKGSSSIVPGMLVRDVLSG